MPGSTPPTELEDRIQWLVDHESIRGLLASFAAAVDDKDQAAYAENFTDDGVLELPFGTFEGKEAIAAMKGPPKDWHTQHLFGTIKIELTGDTAAVRAWTMATHVFDAVDLTKKAHAGGWYLFEVARTGDGWRLKHVQLVNVWMDPRPMLPGVPMPGGPPAGGPPAGGPPAGGPPAGGAA